METIDEQKIQNWLVEEGFLKEKIVDNNAEFHYTIEYPQGNIIDVVQPKGKPDFLILVCGTQVSPEHIALIEDATLKEREDFIYELQFKFNDLQIDSQIEVGQDYILRQFVIQDGIYADGLNKNNLVNCIKKIFRAKRSCVLLMEKQFGSVQINNNINSSSNENMMFM